jgi:hypothetical protein
MKKEIEIWRVLPSNENYLISDLGRVQVLPRLTKSGSKLKGKMIKPYLGSNGYFRVKIARKNRLVHQLLAEAFLNHIPCGHKIVVDHINNIQTDNRLVNLQLISNRENSSKDKKGGTSKFVGVSYLKRDKKWRARIRINDKQIFLGSFKSEKEASKYYKNALTCVEENRIDEIKIKEPNFSSKFKGVSLHKLTKKWMSFIRINGKDKYLGLFNSEEEAAKYYQDALTCIEESRIDEIKVKKYKLSSNYKGVHWYKPSKKWRSQITINKKKKHIGFFLCEEEAAKAYQDELNKLNRVSSDFCEEGEHEVIAHSGYCGICNKKIGCVVII